MFPYQVFEVPPGTFKNPEDKKPGLIYSINRLAVFIFTIAQFFPQIS
jgi:hypothetical protein